METQIQFSDIYKGFDSNMQALYDLHVAIEESFGAKEWEFLRAYYAEILPLFSETNDPSEIQGMLERLIKKVNQTGWHHHSHRRGSRLSVFSSR
jgi:hypothetical protein